MCDRTRSTSGFSECASFNTRMSITKSDCSTDSSQSELSRNQGSILPFDYRSTDNSILEEENIKLSKKFKRSILRFTRRL